MKKLSVVFLALVCFSAHAQRWGSEFGINYLYAKPVGSMGKNVAHGNGATLNYGWVVPNRQLSFGFDISVAEYGHDKSRQEYTLDDGSTAPMDIVVSNTFANLMIYSRWYFNTEGLLRPYITGKLGYSGFETTLNVYDPDEFDHCKPIDDDVLYDDGTFIGVLGAGVKLDLASIFKKINQGRFYFEGNLNFTRGGHVRYMNADGPPPNTTHHHSATTAATDADHVMTQFINTDTMVIHEHHVGYLYQSPVQMTELRLGVSMNFGGR